MPFTDAQGRPELVMHPDLVRGAVAYRREPATGDDTASADRAAAAPDARPRATSTRPGKSTPDG